MRVGFAMVKQATLEQCKVSPGDLGALRLWREPTLEGARS